MRMIFISKHILAVFLLLISLAGPLTAGAATRTSLDPSYQIAVSLAPYTTASDAANGAEAINWDGSDPARMRASTEAFAALELRHYLCRLSKANEQDPKVFPIVAMNRSRNQKTIILEDLSDRSANAAVVRAARRENLAQRLSSRESFALVPDADNLLIIGSDRVGVLYGVYSLLEMLGVRWYGPGDMGEVIHASAGLPFPAQTIIEEPKFVTRGFLAWENRGNREFYLWMARNRLNLWTIADTDRASEKQLGLQLDAGLHWISERYLNPDKYMQAHPEWFGLVDGKRQGFKHEFGVNFCTSNAEAVQEFTRNLLKDLSTGDWRDTDLLELWPLDVGKWCECDNCRRLGTPTDRLLTLVMHVRDALEAARRQGLIHHPIELVFPIYHETLPLPANPRWTPADYRDLIGTFFPIGRCYVHTLDDPDCTEYNTDYWQILETWKQRDKYPGQLEVGEYYNVSTMKSLPVIYKRIMAHDLPLYYAQGARHFHYMHVYTRLQGPKRLNNYLMAQLLWNPDANVEQLFSEYLNDFYGAGAGDARRFYDRLEFAMSSIQQWKHYGGEHEGECLVDQINRHADVLFGTEHLKLEEYHPAKNAGVSLGESVRALQECRTIMDRLRAEDLPGEVKLRLAEDDRNLRYAENTVNLYYYMAQALMARKQQNLEQARQFYRRTVPYAQGLRNETEILQTASSHANARDGLDASLVEDAYKQLGEQLGVTSN